MSTFSVTDIVLHTGDTVGTKRPDLLLWKGSRLYEKSWWGKYQFPRKSGIGSVCKCRKIYLCFIFFFPSSCTPVLEFSFHSCFLFFLDRVFPSVPHHGTPYQIHAHLCHVLSFIFSSPLITAFKAFFPLKYWSWKQAHQRLWEVLQ